MADGALTCEESLVHYVDIGQLSRAHIRHVRSNFRRAVMEHERTVGGFPVVMKLPLLLYAQLFIVKEDDGFLMELQCRAGK